MDEDRKIRVLVCDDDPADRSLVRQLLRMVTGMKFELEEFDAVERLIERLSGAPADVIMLDVHLRGASGLEWLKEINSMEKAPVVIVTGQGDEMMAVEAMRAGAYDYLPKFQYSVGSITKAIMNAMERWELEAQIKQYRKDLLMMARTDMLTGILNRRSLMEALKDKTRAAAEGAGRLSLVMIDIDHFKKINDTFGHDAGDEVLKGVCRTVECALSEGDVFGRYGGEEFVVILPGKTLDEAVKLAEDCRGRVEAARLPVTISLGVAEYSGGAGSYEELIKRADTALYNAKGLGRNRVEAL